ncbi:hypothetical protein [Dyadobacter sp. LHD-138]|uniref:hypothetical protein n=1 Tax=Dyadobacter sp. LHD-138 TaxID=3071413 RepID=UPI0027DF54D3|nr:hypothetical protein [Dyadobacter sp. LHD-138]MDQ6480680.1 hypothetical protein [Dyadobacter sp. LHD-138]
MRKSIEIPANLRTFIWLSSICFFSDSTSRSHINFAAGKSESGNIIFWSTSSETNNAGFEIERSADTKSITTIAKINGKVSSKLHNNYQFTDTTPLADSYYKLKQID